MTNSQAKSELMQIYMSLSEGKKQALDIAFKALEQEPCEYAVDREQVNDILGHCIHSQEDYYLAIKMLNELPSVNPQEKTEHWIITYPHGKQNPIYECPRCHASNSSVFKNSCPNCGARMVEPQERSE